ncbi:MAG TPA: HYR domain-containing protein [Chitinophagales bacterium]|nr:HYR domain-containing protein [Chitinophagales bacterium]HRK28423.1 HYR domain-containing protein [Chitinophagales bacterium]
MNRYLQVLLFSMLLCIGIAVCYQEVLAQPSSVATNNLSGSPFNCTNLIDYGAFRQARILANQSSSATTWEFPADCSFPGNVWRPFNAGNCSTPLPLNTVIQPVSGSCSALYNSSNGGVSGNLAATTLNRYYTFNVEDKVAPNNLFMSVLETTYNPKNISSVSACTISPGTNQVVQIFVGFSATPSVGEFGYVRYTTDNFATSSLVQVVFTGSSGVADIPAFSAGTTVRYYAYSSNRTLLQITTDVTTYGQVAHDMNTLSILNNGGSNYAYTVSSSTVTLPTINPGGPTTFCPGGSVQLVATAFAGYQWNAQGGNANTQSITATQTGTYVVTVTYASGCTASASIFVNATDSTPPTISCPATKNITLGPTCQISLPNYTGEANANDNCSLQPVTQSPVAATFLSGHGTTTVILTATDGSGNTATCSFSVNRNDVTPPTISCPAGPFELYLNSTCSTTMPTYNPTASNDNCGAPTITQSPVSGSNLSGVGQTTVILTASDVPNNTATCSFFVNRLDTIKPNIVCPNTQSINLDASCSATLPSYNPTSVSDNCTTTPSVTQTPSSGSFVSGVGSTTVTLTAQDASGNTRSCSFTVNRLDITPPVIACPGGNSVTVDGNCSALVPSFNPIQLSDECGTVSFTQFPNVGSTTTGTGNLTVTLTATDGSNNTGTCSVLLNRIDNSAPVIVCPSTQTLSKGAGCAATLPAYSLVSAVDNCNSNLTFSQSPAAGTSVSGDVVQVSLFANDGFNPVFCNFNVNLIDNTPPSLVCPSTQTLLLNASCQASLPTYSPTSAVDNCNNPPIVTQSPSVGTPYTGSGSVTVTLTASDFNNNSSTCSFTVNRTDNIAPTISCPINQTLILGTTCTIPLPAYNATAVADNCGATSVNQSPLAGTTLTGAGITTVILTASDGSGNTATCSFQATRIDNASPSVVCPGPQTLGVSAGCTAIIPTYMPISVSDNCGTPSVSQLPLPGTNISGFGLTTVSFTVNDGNGNSTSCSFSVNRVDNAPPTLTCPGTQSINLNTSCAGTLGNYVSGATVVDNCAATPTVTQSPVSGTSVSGVGSSTVTLTASDGNGNTATCSFLVNRVDVTLPNITCPTGVAALTLNANCQATLPTYNAQSATDNCGTPAVSQSPISGTVITGVGSTTVTLTATDSNNNTRTCSFSVNRVDTAPPTITCPTTQTLTLSANCTVALPAYSGTSADNCSTPTVTQSPIAGTTLTGVGSSTVILTAVDAGNLTATCSFTITRVDNTPPTISCPATQTLTLNSNCATTLPAYSAASVSDNCAAAPTVTQAPASGVALSGVGSSTVTLTASDGNGNTATCSFTVNRVDTTPPAITCPTAQTLTLGATCTVLLPAYNATTTTDNCNTPAVTQSPLAGITLTGVGATTVTLTANDGNGNTNTCSFAVNRVDTTPPTITCPNNIVQNSTATTCDATVNWTTPTTADNCSVISVVPSTTSGSTFAGNSTVTYTVTDASNNTATCSFTVTINDAQPPILTGCPANLISCNGIANWTPPTATDNCVAVSLTSTHQPGSAFGLGTTTVTYTATDLVNNSTTCSFTVTVSLLTATVTTSNYNGFNISCNGGSNGSITVIPANGAAPYSYNWNTGVTGTNTLTGLPTGFYAVTITDQNGCSIVRTAVLSQPQPLVCSATSTNVTCIGGTNGTATATTAGGTAPYSYTWNGPGAPFANAANISELQAGTYSVTTTDNNGCTCANTVTINEPTTVPPPLTGTNIDVSQGEGGFLPTFYNVNIINFSGGAAPYNYTWSISGGYVYYSVLSTGVIQVIYGDNAAWSVTISDSYVCGVSTLVFSSGNDPNGVLDIVSSSISSDSGTNTGAIVLAVGGGQPCPGGVYQYQWAGPTVWTGAATATTGSISNLPTGWYIVTVTDCSNPAQSTLGWFWVPKAIRGRGKAAFTNDLIQVTPNPFAHSTGIQFSWPQDDRLSLNVYDITGKMVAQIFEGEVQADEVYRANFDAANLPAGLYVCRLVNAEGIAVQAKALLVEGSNR